MANTERLLVIQKLRTAREAVGAARSDPKLTDEARADLYVLWSTIDRVEGVLILEEIKDRVDALAADAKKLKDVADEMASEVKKLAGVADLVDKAADALATFVKIAGMAATLV